MRSPGWLKAGRLRVAAGFPCEAPGPYAVFMLVKGPAAYASRLTCRFPHVSRGP